MVVAFVSVLSLKEVVAHLADAVYYGDEFISGAQIITALGRI
jgi:hypothetical protein